MIAAAHTHLCAAVLAVECKQAALGTGSITLGVDGSAGHTGTAIGEVRIWTAVLSQGTGRVLC